MHRPTPPQRFLNFFRWFCHPSLRNSIEGDLIELYYERCELIGKQKADRKFIIDILLLFRPGIIKPAEGHQRLNNYGMFKNYFKVGIRNILKYRMFSFINIFGLAVAMSVCMLIILMLADQKRYDAFQVNKERVYRILSDSENSRQAYATSPFPLASTLKSDYPIIEESTSLNPSIGGDVVYGERLSEMRGYFADPAFFQVFSFELEKGDKSTALSAPKSIVISRVLADKLFVNEDPIGKTVEFFDRQLSFPQDHGGVGAPAVTWGSFTITGVIDESNFKSHLKFDALVSSSSQPLLYSEKKLEDQSGNWDWYFRTYTYALIEESKTEDDLKTALNDLVARKYASLHSDQVKGFTLIPQKLEDVQLGLQGNDTDNRMPKIGYYFLIILAGIIMFTAGLNYTNLSIARALTRAKEIGIRKVTGAGRRSLIFQFLSESVLTALLSLAMAVLLLYFIIPGFKNLWVNNYLNFELPLTFPVYLSFIAFAILIGVLAGIYPAFHLSGYQPIKALKNLNNIRPGKLGMRKVISVSQFVISLFFITTSILVFNQFKHFIQFDYGFTSKNIVNIELQGMDYKKLANELGTLPGVSTISASDIIPATNRSNGIGIRKMGSAEDHTASYIILIDENFINNLDLKIIAGRNLKSSETSSNHFVVINEEASKKLGYKNASDAVGQVLETNWNNESVEVIGVVEDFRYKHLLNTHAIDPLVLRNTPDQFQYLNVKVISPDLIGTVALLEAKWKKLDPNHAFKYEFYDQQLAATHQGIFDLVSILGFISLLAIIIACLGLLGMATYTAERRTKEVGIRKVMGAGEFAIAVLLSKEFLKMLAVSVMIGAPVSYLINKFWLQYLPNRVDFGIGTVLLGVIILSVLGLLTIGSQALRASKNNPVDSLRMD